jgi:hypothetical protein
MVETLKGVLLRSAAEPATTPMVEQARRLWRLCFGEELQEERFNVEEAYVPGRNEAEEAEVG